MSISKRQHVQSPFDPAFQPSTLIELLRFRVANQPGQVAYTFLPDGEGQATQIDYQELERRALAVAARLQEGQADGERILLLYPSGLEFHVAFMGCIYAGAVAVPAYPPRANRNLIRLNALVADAQANKVLTTASILLQLQSM